MPGIPNLHLPPWGGGAAFVGLFFLHACNEEPTVQSSSDSELGAKLQSFYPTGSNEQQFAATDLVRS